MRWRKPAIDNAKHGKTAHAEPEGQRLLFTAITGVALHTNRHVVTIPPKRVQAPDVSSCPFPCAAVISPIQSNVGFGGLGLDRRMTGVGRLRPHDRSTWPAGPRDIAVTAFRISATLRRPTARSQLLAPSLDGHEATVKGRTQDRTGSGPRVGDRQISRLATGRNWVVFDRTVTVPDWQVCVRLPS